MFISNVFIISFFTFLTSPPHRGDAQSDKTCVERGDVLDTVNSQRRVEEGQNFRLPFNHEGYESRPISMDLYLYIYLSI